MKLLSIFPPIKVTAASLHTIRSRYLDLIRRMAFVSSHLKKKLSALGLFIRDLSIVRLG